FLRARTCHQENMKKSQEINKGKRKECNLTTFQRKQRDSEITQQKQKAANEKSERPKSMEKQSMLMARKN
uniref:Small EDRK-rich factor-like N-terminal domain-containing protein n=1 Tax=Panthera leo TaxID=9689 RepID=A0A8C8XQ85_PANLE